MRLWASGSVRASRIPQSATSAPEVHTFCPVTTHSSPSRTPRVRREARSLPASGSLKSWHQSSSPFSIGARKRSRWGSVPWRRIVGPAMPMPTAKGPTFTP